MCGIVDLLPLSVRGNQVSGTFLKPKYSWVSAWKYAHRTLRLQLRDVFATGHKGKSVVPGDMSKEALSALVCFVHHFVATPRDNVGNRVGTYKYIFWVHEWLSGYFAFEWKKSHSLTVPAPFLPALSWHPSPIPYSPWWPHLEFRTNSSRASCDKYGGSIIIDNYTFSYMSLL